MRERVPLIMKQTSGKEPLPESAGNLPVAVSEEP